MATRRIAQINLSLEFKICVDGGRAPSVLMPMVAVPHLDCCLLGGALFNVPRINSPEAMRSAVVATTQRASDTMCVPEQDVKDGESKLRVGCLRFATGLPRGSSTTQDKRVSLQAEADSENLFCRVHAEAQAGS